MLEEPQTFDNLTYLPLFLIAFGITLFLVFFYLTHRNRVRFIPISHGYEIVQGNYRVSVQRDREDYWIVYPMFNVESEEEIEIGGKYETYSQARQASLDLLKQARQ